jgi:putative ABC transport system permease protein
MNFSETIKLSWASVRANGLRSTLTLLIIAFGLMALVGILAALDSLLFSLNENFNDMGSNSFVIERKYQNARNGRRTQPSEPISYEEAMSFKERFNYPSLVTVSVQATSGATLQNGDKKTNPTVSIFGIDDNYLSVKGYDLSLGRDFSTNELETGSMKAIIGTDIVKLLFKDDPTKALGADISIGNIRYRVIGILKGKGSSGGQQGGDRLAMIPLVNAKRIYDNKGNDFGINVSTTTATDLENAVQVATGLFRQVRRLRIDQPDDFEIFKSDGLLDLLKENTVKIRWATIGIALITLLGASIGLMNIMLVSVTERTREIGIRKALGATSTSILRQFLTEAILICQLGGVVGISLGVLAGLGVSVAMKSSFVMPWGWIFVGIIVCFAVGLFAGLYPALKASRLDPIESLRYE